VTTYESNPTGPMASGSIATPAGARAAAGGDGALNGQRNPDELRAELSRLRTEVGETLEALIQRLDVPARVQGKAREVTERAKHTATQVVDQAQQKAQDARQLVAQKVPDVVKQRRAQTALAGVVMLVGLLVTGIVVRRSR
jgi:hypothetical protein